MEPYAAFGDAAPAAANDNWRAASSRSRHGSEDLLAHQAAFAADAGEQGGSMKQVFSRVRSPAAKTRACSVSASSRYSLTVSRCSPKAAGARSVDSSNGSPTTSPAIWSRSSRSNCR